MKTQIQSKLISIGVFVAFIAERFMLHPIDNELDLILAAYIIPFFLFLFFWILRSILKSIGRWHSSGTVWLVFLMTLFSIWGIYYFFFLHGNDPLSSLNKPLHQLALFGSLMGVLYLMAEIVIAVVSWFYRLLEKRFSHPPAA